MAELRDAAFTGVAVRRPEDARPDRWAFAPARLARLDRLSALALLAVDAALLDAGLGQESIAAGTWVGERVALVLGTAFGCHATNEEFYRGYLAEGAKGASPRLFAATLPSTAAGELSIHYGLRGPVETLTSGAHAGLEAIARAAALCGAGRADVAIAVAADVGGPAAAALGLEIVEGAAAFVLERASGAAARGAPVRARPAAAASAFSSGDPATALRRLAAAQGLPVDDPGLPARGGGAFAAAHRLAARLTDGPLPRGEAFAAADPEGAAVLLLVDP